MHLSLMEPTLDGDEKSDASLLGNDDEADMKAVELLKVELVLNVPPKEEGGKCTYVMATASLVPISHFTPA